MERTRGLHGARGWVIALWILFYVVLIDASINVAFRYPQDPQVIDPTFLQDYFEYGRSVEGKLAVMTKKSESESAPKVRGGWLKSDKHTSLPNRTSKPDEVLVALYGMSHTECLWEAMQKLNEKYLIRGFMSAGATPNWAYAAYELDNGRHKADAVVLGLMTEGVSLVTSTTGMTAYFDNSYPYTFPRYSVRNGAFSVSYPPFMDAKKFIQYFYDEKRWDEYRKWLVKNDKWYDQLLFRKSLLDHSSFVRLLRRAYSEREKQKIVGSVYNGAGFIENSEEVAVVRAIVKLFAESARGQGIIPVVYIVNLQGQGDHLFKMLESVLDANKIAYLSTHIICPPDDPRVYLAENSHFTPSKDIELAKEMINIIQEQLNKKKIKSLKESEKVLSVIE